MARQSAAQEAAAVAEDLAAQELGADAAPRVHVTSTAYIRGVDPDSGLDVVFVPGEGLPSWVADRLDKAEQVADNPVTLVLP